jgi:hypothetical protein
MSNHIVLDSLTPLPIGNPQEVPGPASFEPDPQPMRSCVACGREISLDVLICPYCDNDYEAMRTPPERPDEVKSELPPPPPE